MLNKADEQANEERQKQMLEARLNTSEAQYQLILNIFSKMTGTRPESTTASGRA